MRVLVVAGGTGGHVYPAIALIDALKGMSPGARVLLAVPRSPLSERLVAGIEHVSFIPRCPVSGLRLSNPRGFARLARLFLESLKLLLKFKPDIAVGFGTFDGIPLMALAWLTRAKTVIHEQNAVPGRANRFLSRLVDEVAVSFPDTKRCFGISPRRVVVTGNPVRKEMQVIRRADAAGFFGMKETGRIILVAGGSQGSSSLNTVFVRAVSGLDLGDVQIIHIAGAQECDTVGGMYRSEAPRARVRIFPFLKEMAYAYSACDFAVCRSGAMTVSELIRFSVPAILVPYPYAEQHQAANAQFLEKNGCAVIIKEDVLSAEVMRKAIADFLGGKPALAALRAGYKNLPKPDEGQLLAKEVIRVAQPYTLEA